MSLPKIYRGSVKDVLGPVALTAPNGSTVPAVVFEYTDSYSVYDWGKMPDSLPKKGEALAILAAHWFDRIERPESWKEFSRSPEALELRKSNRFGAAFNEAGERLQSEGIRTHYVGVAQFDRGGDNFNIQPINDLQGVSKNLVVRQVSITQPTFGTLLGRMVPDYLKTHTTAYPRLIPLEFVFRFGCPTGSSLLDRVKQDPDYLSARGYPNFTVSEGDRWGFPVLEMFTKLETSDRPVTLAEGLAISGVSAVQLQEVLFKTAWLAALIKSYCSKAGLELADGKLEWAIDQNGNTFLVDAIGPDELRILSTPKGGRLTDGVQLSKEFLRGFYRGTPWYELMIQAKKHAAHHGIADWKKFVTMSPAALPPSHREAGSHLYMALTNRLTGKNWFPEAWDLDKVISTIQDLSASGLHAEPSSASEGAPKGFGA